MDWIMFMEQAQEALERFNAAEYAVVFQQLEKESVPLFDALDEPDTEAQTLLDTRPIKEMDCRSWHQEQAYHVPLLQAYLCHASDSSRYRHLYRFKDAYPQERFYNSDIRRPGQRKEKGNRR